MSRSTHSADFKAKVVLKVIQGEQELSEIAARKNNLFDHLPVKSDYL